MVDKVKPLKIEDASSGTEIDVMPVEADPTEDYLAGKGLSLRNLDTYLIDDDGSEIQFTDPTNSTKKISDLLDAEQEVFDPGATDLTSTLTGPAIRELRAKVSASASPGYNYGRSGNVSNNTWLQVAGGVPSNKTGITVGFSSPEITTVVTSSQDANTYDISIYEHEGDETNLTLLDTYSVTASRSETFDSLTVSVTEGRQLAVKISSGSAKNIVVQISLTGEFA